MATRGSTSQHRGSRFVALLRGVNLGGKTKVEMAVLRQLLDDAGGTDIQTHLNSGNALFAARSAAAAVKICTQVEKALTAAYGRSIPIVLRSSTALGKALAHEPFPGADPSRVLVAFLSKPAPAEIVAALQAIDSGRDEVVAHGSELFLHCPDGIAESKLALAASKPGADIVSTARNWRTVTRLHQLSAPSA